jgi:hypothetical protein
MIARRILGVDCWKEIQWRDQKKGSTWEVVWVGDFNNLKVEVAAVGSPKEVVVVGQHREEREVAEDLEEGEDQVMEEAVQKGEEAVIANQKGEEAVMEDPKEEGVVTVEERVDINPEKGVVTVMEDPKEVVDIDHIIGMDIRSMARDMIVGDMMMIIINNY